jgi:hypothetical protein
MRFLIFMIFIFWLLLNFIFGGCHPSRSPLLPRQTGTGEDVTPLDLPSRGEDISPLFLPYCHGRQEWGECVILLAIVLVTPLDLHSRKEFCHPSGSPLKGRRY